MYNNVTQYGTQQFKRQYNNSNINDRNINVTYMAAIQCGSDDKQYMNMIFASDGQYE